MFLNCLFYSSNSQKPKDNQFVMTYDKEKQQILTTEELELQNVWHFCWKMN